MNPKMWEDTVRTKIVSSALVAVIAATAAATSDARSSATVHGAGSTFVAPLVALWGGEYKGADIAYNGVGSGAGIDAITNHQVDFGASDAPLTQSQKSACPCVQIPWALSATSVAYNI